MSPAVNAGGCGVDESRGTADGHGDEFAEPLSPLAGLKDATARVVALPDIAFNGANDVDLSRLDIVFQR